MSEQPFPLTFSLDTLQSTLKPDGSTYNWLKKTVLPRLRPAAISLLHRENFGGENNRDAYKIANEVHEMGIPAFIYVPRGTGHDPAWWEWKGKRVGLRPDQAVDELARLRDAGYPHIADLHKEVLEDAANSDEWQALKYWCIEAMRRAQSHGLQIATVGAAVGTKYYHS